MNPQQKEILTATKNAFVARLILFAPTFCATKAERADMKLMGTSARKTKSFSAMPTLAEATTPRELRMDVMIKKDTVT